MALDEEVWRSNLGRRSEIERLRVKGARAAALAAPAACSHGGATPEKTELGLPGVDSNGGWVRRHLRCMRKPLVAKSGHRDGWSVELDGRAARRGEVSPDLARIGRSGAR